MILLACALGDKVDSRKAEVTSRIPDLQANGPVEVRIISDFLRATFQAEELISSGEVVVIAACLADMSIPKDCEVSGFGVIEWRESWLARLEKNKIGFLPLATAESPPVPREAILATAIIRSFTRASRAMDAAIRTIQAQESRARQERVAEDTGYVCGRPPFGYRAVKGRLEIVEKHAAAVRLIFEAYRKSRNMNACVEKAKDAKLKGYWDRVKVRRILSHAPLYCRGECNFRGKSVLNPDLAFLPENWQDTYPKTKDTP